MLRNRLPELLQVFDFPDPNRVVGQRNVSTRATQALALLNSPEVLQLARLAAQRLLEDAGLHSRRQRIATLYLRTLTRQPNDAELAAALEHLATAEGSSEDGWTMLCQAVLASVNFRYR